MTVFPNLMHCTSENFHAFTSMRKKEYGRKGNSSRTVTENQQLNVDANLERGRARSIKGLQTIRGLRCRKLQRPEPVNRTSAESTAFFKLPDPFLSFCECYDKDLLGDHLFCSLTDSSWRNPCSKHSRVPNFAEVDLQDSVTTPPLLKAIMLC